MADVRLRRLGATRAAPTANRDDTSASSTVAPSPRDAAAVAVAEVVASSSSSSASALAESHSRERIAGSPLVPDGVRWADDGRVAVVSEASILISTFLSRELEMYIQHSPAISKSFIFVPDAAQIALERVPLKMPVFSEPTDAALPSGSLTYFLLHERDRHQYNPKEVSLSKNDGTAFLAATWGPRGSGPNASCAVLALTSSSRISLHFSSSFHISWKQVAVFSENLYDFLASRHWTLSSPSASSASSLTPVKSMKAEAESLAMPANKTTKGAKKRRRLSTATATTTTSDNASDATMSMAEYARRCALLSTLSIAWSPFVTNAEQHTTSLIALCGRAITTVWGYDAPSFEAFAAVDNATPAHFLSPTPLVWLDTEPHGWVTTSTWQQLHRRPHHVVAELRLAMGTCEGNVLLANVPVVPRDIHVAHVPIDRVVVAPHRQPVFGLRLGSRHTFSNSDRNNLVVASGSRLSVWNLQSAKKKKLVPEASWHAHDGNVTGLDVDYFGDKIFSCGVDGRLRLWDAATGTELPYVATSESELPAAPRYPLFGLTVSPNSAQLACLYVVPPAARPNRKSQADVSYSRVSAALEYLPTPYASHPHAFVETMCKILEQGRDMSTMADVLWFCHEDNALITSLQGSADLTLPHLLNKLKGVGGGRNGEDARQPLYLSLCRELERRNLAATDDTSDEPAATPLFLQASYLLRRCIPPAEHHTSVRDAALTTTTRALYVYWAERCLRALLASHSQVQNFADISKTERIAALLMADFLSVQSPLSASMERLVTTIYNRLGSQDTIGKWSAYLQARVESAPANGAVAPVAPVPPPRQTCLICDDAVPFGELEQFCVAGHVQDRCFLSFQVLASMDTWKCMGCGACASEIDFSQGRAPFYLLEGQTTTLASSTTSSSTMQIVCRLCGNYCSFLRY